MVYQIQNFICKSKTSCYNRNGRNGDYGLVASTLLNYQASAGATDFAAAMLPPSPQTTIAISGNTADFISRDDDDDFEVGDSIDLNPEEVHKDANDDEE